MNRQARRKCYLFFLKNRLIHRAIVEEISESLILLPTLINMFIPLDDYKNLKMLQALP